MHSQAWSLGTRESNVAWGHASMLLDDGTYISWWPKEGAGIFNAFEDQEALMMESLDDDIRNEGQRYDFSYYISFLDEIKIKNYWLKFKKKGKYNPVFQNCSTTVAEALREGGSQEYSNRWFDIVWTPNDVKEYVEDILNNYYSNIWF